MQLGITEYHFYPPAHFAAGTDNCPALSALIDLGIAIDARDPWNNTPLLIAAHYSSNDCLQLLLGRGAYICACNIDGQTPLSVANQRVMQIAQLTNNPSVSSTQPQQMHSLPGLAQILNNQSNFE